VTISPRSSLLERLEPTVGRMAALDEIRRRLAIDTEIFEHHGDDGRAGAHRALIDVMNYFASRGIPRASLEPLAALADAVAKAERGIISPLLGRPPGPPAAELRQMELFAAVMECCVRHYRAAGAAAYMGAASRKAAELVNGSSLAERVTPRTMSDAREQVMDLPARADGRRQFDALIDCDVAKLSPLEWAQTLVQHDWTAPWRDGAQEPLDPAARGK
jgi:hypothetical protein